MIEDLSLIARVSAKLSGANVHDGNCLIGFYRSVCYSSEKYPDDPKYDWVAAAKRSHEAMEWLAETADSTTAYWYALGKIERLDPRRVKQILLDRELMTNYRRVSHQLHQMTDPFTRLRRRDGD